MGVLSIVARVSANGLILNPNCMVDASGVSILNVLLLNVVLLLEVHFSVIEDNIRTVFS